MVGTQAKEWKSEQIFIYKDLLNLQHFHENIFDLLMVVYIPDENEIANLWKRALLTQGKVENMDKVGKLPSIVVPNNKRLLKISSILLKSCLIVNSVPILFKSNVVLYMQFVMLLSFILLSDLTSAQQFIHYLLV